MTLRQLRCGDRVAEAGCVGACAARRTSLSSTPVEARQTSGTLSSLPFSCAGRVCGGEACTAHQSRTMASNTPGTAEVSVGTGGRLVCARAQRFLNACAVARSRGRSQPAFLPFSSIQAAARPAAAAATPPRVLPGGDFGALLRAAATPARDGDSQAGPSPSPSPPPRAPPVIGPDLRRGSPTRLARGPLTSDQVRAGGVEAEEEEEVVAAPAAAEAAAPAVAANGANPPSAGHVSPPPPPPEQSTTPPSEAEDDAEAATVAAPAALPATSRSPSPSASSVESKEEEEEGGRGASGPGKAGDAADAATTTTAAARPRPRPGRHFIIATLAGKPVWCFSSSEENQPSTSSSRLASVAAVAGALADYAAARGDALASLTVGGESGDGATPHSHSTTRIATLQRGNLRLTAASDLDESEAASAADLDALHAQVLAVLTTGLHRAVGRDPGLDAARLLAGAEPTLMSVVAGLDGPDAAVLTGAYPPLPLPAALRRCATTALATAVEAGGAAGGGLLLVGGLVAALAGGARKGSAPAAWSPGDVHALTHFVLGSPSLTRPGIEACAPVCLPFRDPARLWHAYVAGCPEVEEERRRSSGGGESGGGAAPAPATPPATLILLGDRASDFPALARAGRAAVAALRRDGVLAAAGMAARAPGGGRLSVSDLPPALLSPRPLHFALRSVTRGQVLASGPADPSVAAAAPPPGGYARARAALVGGRGRLGFGPVEVEGEEGGATVPRPPAPAPPRLRTHWARRGGTAVLGLAGPEYEVFATFPAAGTDPGAAAAVFGAGLTAWVRGRAGDLFV